MPICEVIKICCILFGDMFTHTQTYQNTWVLHISLFISPYLVYLSERTRHLSEALERRNGGNGFNQFSHSVMSDSL